MKFYTQQHRYYCGIDLHARTMYLCVLNQQGVICSGITWLAHTANHKPPFLSCAVASGGRALQLCSGAADL